MFKHYDINDYLKDDKELQKAVIRELFKEITTQQGTIDAYKMSENEANEIIAELKAENEILKTQLNVLEDANKKLSSENDSFYNNSLQEVKKDLVQRVWKLQKQYAEVVNQFEIESLTDITTGETIYRSNLVNKLKHILQEIKAIVCSNYEIIDHQGRKDILKLINKTEEE